MTIDPTRHVSNTTTDDVGWLIAACTCGWSFGPVPDDETATDVLMEPLRRRRRPRATGALEPAPPAPAAVVDVGPDPDQLTIYDEAGDA